MYPVRLRTPRSARRCAGHGRTALLGATILILTAAGSPGDNPEGLGDRLYPSLGNPGYNVFNYDLAFTYRGKDSPLDAVTGIDALATDNLSRFSAETFRLPPGLSPALSHRQQDLIEPLLQKDLHGID